MTTIIRNIFAVSKRHLRIPAVGGILLLSFSLATAQVADDLSTPARSGSGVAGTANPAGTTTETNDDGEPSSTFEFVSPVRAVTTAPGAAAGSGSFVINPASATLSSSTVSMPTGNTAVTLDAPRSGTGVPASAKVGVCALLVGGLFILGVAVVRAVTQERARGRSLEA